MKHQHSEDDAHILAIPH